MPFFGKLPHESPQKNALASLDLKLSVSGSVINSPFFLQLAHLRVFQIYLFDSLNGCSLNDSEVYLGCGPNLYSPNELVVQLEKSKRQ